MSDGCWVTDDECRGDEPSQAHQSPSSIKAHYYSVHSPHLRKKPQLQATSLDRRLSIVPDCVKAAKQAFSPRSYSDSHSVTHFSFLRNNSSPGLPRCTSVYRTFSFSSAFPLLHWWSLPSLSDLVYFLWIIRCIISSPSTSCIVVPPGSSP